MSIAICASVKMKRGDTAPSLTARLRGPSDTPGVLGDPLDLSGAGTTVAWEMAATGGGTPMGGACTILDDGSPDNRGLVRYDWQSSDTVNAGRFLGEFEVVLPSGKIETFPNDGWVEVVIVPDLG